MNDYVELRKVIAIVRRRVRLLILITLVTAASGYIVSERHPPLYEATSTIMVGEVFQATELSRANLLTSEVLARTYADMALRQPVLQGVIDTLGLPVTVRTLRKGIRVQLVEGTQLIQIKAEAGTTELARAIADEVARQLILLSPTAMQNQEQAANREFVSQRLASLQTKIELGQARLDTLARALVESQSGQRVQELQATINTLETLVSSWESNHTQMLIYMEQQAPSNSLTVIEPAQANPRPVRPRTYLNTILAAAVGCLYALGLVFLLEFWDDTLKSTADVTQTLGLTALGAIHAMGEAQPQKKLLLSQDPASPVAEAYRIIRSNFEFKTADDPVRSIVVTSPGPGEGKSMMVANLGIIMAQAGLRTVIVDADLRQPVQHHLFQIANSSGLTEAIRAPELDLGALLISTKVPNLQVLTSGEVPPNPAELLRSEDMRQVLARLSEQADLVICDSPPALGLADAGILANRADGLVLVIEAGQTHRDAARQAISELHQADANVIGAILNRWRPEHRRYYSAARKTASSASTAHSRSNRRWQWLPF